MVACSLPRSTNIDTERQRIKRRLHRPMIARPLVIWEIAGTDNHPRQARLRHYTAR